MKTILYLIAAVSVFSLSSCDSFITEGPVLSNNLAETSIPKSWQGKYFPSESSDEYIQVLDESITYYSRKNKNSEFLKEEGELSINNGSLVLSKINDDLYILNFNDSYLHHNEYEFVIIEKKNDKALLYYLAFDDIYKKNTGREYNNELKGQQEKIDFLQNAGFKVSVPKNEKLKYGKNFQIEINEEDILDLMHKGYFSTAIFYQKAD